MNTILNNSEQQNRITPRTPLTDSVMFRRDSDGFPAFMPNGKPWPKISIITPSYNQGRFVEDMIQSVIEQKYPNLEHIFIDGASTDETLQVVAAYRSHFVTVISEPDKGQSDALNKGFGIATGSILTWINCDDLLAPGALFAIALAFHASEADMIAGGCRLFNQDGTEQPYHLTSCSNGQLSLSELLDIDNCWLACQFFCQPEVMFTRELWNRAGGYINESLYYCMDYELWVRFAVNGAKLHVISSPIAHYRMHSEQKTVTVEAYRPELIKTVRQLQEKYLPLMKLERITLKQTLKMVFFNDNSFETDERDEHSTLAQACARAGHDVTLLCHKSKKSEDFLPDILKKVKAVSPDIVVVGSISERTDTQNYFREFAKQFLTVVIRYKQRYIENLSSVCNNKMIDNDSDHVAVVDTGCDLYMLYRNFYLSLKQLGLNKQLGISPAIKFPLYGMINSDTAFLNEDTSSCKQDELVQRRNAFKKWLAMLINGMTRNDPSLSLKKELVESIMDKQIIVFGAGNSYLNGIKRILDKCSLKPQFIVDNDPKKTGSHLEGIPIYLPDKLMTLKKGDFYIFVTSMYYTEIKQQLEDISLCEVKHFIRLS
jgi:glycosyltransferase involved in cell wall biosynthesis